jgi:hypothetical protein
LVTDSGRTTCLDPERSDSSSDYCSFTFGISASMATEVHHRNIGAASTFLFCHFHISWSLGKGKERKASSHDCFSAHKEAARIEAGPSDGKTMMKGANLEFFWAFLLLGCSFCCTDIT